MSNNKLPPELVEKMHKIVRNEVSMPLIADQCAQIAVQYSRWSTIENERLKAERDELLEALSKCEKSLSYIGSDTTELKQLLKKHEDGKE